jgi:probable F420-dependent oxidoreductase
MLRVYAHMDQRLPLSRVGALAQRAEALGFDGLSVPEAVHDGLLAASEALRSTRRLRVATGVLVAFPRSPMALAIAAWDLQELSRGRFELGIGSQVRGNLVGRYATAWSAPVPRMREYVGALRAIFGCWQRGERLEFRGEHYRFERMQPFFQPAVLDCGEPPILLAAVGPRMTALAGEVADALLTHPTQSAPRILRERVAPQLARGAARAARAADAVEIRVGGLVATGPDAAAVRLEREKARRLLGFLFSTPAYARALELFGWQERGAALRDLARRGCWDAMPEQVDDAMLDALVPSAPYAEIADALREAYGGLAACVGFPIPEDPAFDAPAAAAIRALREE